MVKSLGEELSKADRRGEETQKNYTINSIITNNHKNYANEFIVLLVCLLLLLPFGSPSIPLSFHPFHSHLVVLSHNLSIPRLWDGGIKAEENMPRAA